jgi:thiamine-monophosphate kinase
LGPGREFGVIRDIAARLGATADQLGDDCALVDVGGVTLAISIDASVEGVHYRTDWLTPEEIGWRAAAAALSDLAAEAAQPLGVLVSLGGPSAVDFPAIMGGVGAAAASVGAKVLGGDLVRADQGLVDVCAFGTCESPVRRAGARAGDGVWVTGHLGASLLALRSWEAGHRPAPEMARRFARPEPRIAAGLWLARQGATAMIDVSDGLSSDARHLAAASEVGLEIELERIPRLAEVDPMDAAASGEEYELLVTLPPTFAPEQAQELVDLHGLSLSRVGTCIAGAGVRFMRRGLSWQVPPSHDHFAAP